MFDLTSHNRASVGIIPNKSTTDDGGVPGSVCGGYWVGSEDAVRAYEAVVKVVLTGSFVLWV